MRIVEELVEIWPNAVCDNSIPSISLQKLEVVLESCNNIVCNKTTSFKIPVTLWVYGKRVQTKALVDSGATINFVDRVVMENNNLVTHKLLGRSHSEAANPNAR